LGWRRPSISQVKSTVRVGSQSVAMSPRESLLYEAAQVMMTRTTKWNWLKVWALQLAKRSGFERAVVALARRLAVVLHRIWVDGTEFRWTREVMAAT
jgi:transposase